MPPRLVRKLLGETSAVLGACRSKSPQPFWLGRLRGNDMKRLVLAVFFPGRRVWRPVFARRRMPQRSGSSGNRRSVAGLKVAKSQILLAAGLGYLMSENACRCIFPFPDLRHSNRHFGSSKNEARR